MHGFWEDLPGERLDLLVSDRAHRTAKPEIICHVFSSPLPSNAIWHIRDNLYCTSPAFTALLYCRGRSLAECIVLLMELLGTYTLPESATMPISWGGRWPDNIDEAAVQQKHLNRIEPAVTMKELKALAKWATSSSDRTFRTAVDLALPGSASPGETVMCGMFAPPLRCGGFGLANLSNEGMLLNHRIDFTHDAALMASGIPYAVADAYIPAAKTDLEYNGFDHELENYRVHDGHRNNGLKGMGIKVVAINREQMRDIPALEAIAKSIYKDAGKRFRYQFSGYRPRQAAMLNGLRRGSGLPPV